jgi:Flp pilus assembly pilin Flp
MEDTPMKNLTKFLKNLWKDESAQGATEYILLLIVVVGLVMLFKDKIKAIVSTKIGSLGDSINSVNSQ